MRVLAAILVIAGLLGAGCESVETPQSPAKSTSTSGGIPLDPPSSPPIVADWPADIVPIPEGLPREGVDAGHAFHAKQTDVWVVGTGRVGRILRDDTKAPRHQRFVVELKSNTVLVSHNIDVAPRVPVKRGDPVAFRGEYVWNAQGGIVHWTHRDKRNRKAGGWIAWQGQTFR